MERESWGQRCLEKKLNEEVIREDKTAKWNVWVVFN